MSGLDQKLLGPIEVGPARWLSEEEWGFFKEQQRHAERLGWSLARAASNPWRCPHDRGSLDTCVECRRVVTGEGATSRAPVAIGYFRFVRIEVR
jgi:hypothetical protein